MRSCLMMTGSNPNTGVLVRRGNADTQGECHAMDEAEIGVTQPQPKEPQVFLATR